MKIIGEAFEFNIQRAGRWSLALSYPDEPDR